MFCVSLGLCEGKKVLTVSEAWMMVAQFQCQTLRGNRSLLVSIGSVSKIRVFKEYQRVLGSFTKK